MGAVYRVHSALSGRVEAALKVMKPSGEPDARARFVREAEALSALRHPAIVRVMGFNEDAGRGLLYLVMELAVGETLKRRLERGPMPLPEALATFVPLAGALEHAHAAGIFHRDLKPSNIVLCADGVRLVDFGIAAAARDETASGGHLGTLSYLPPEVFRGERTEPRAIDIYAFGLLVNEALTGTHPFPVEAGLTPEAAAAAVGMRKVQQAALDPGESVPAPLRDIVRRATDPDPRARPEMAEMRRVLASLVERRGAAASSGGPSTSPRVPMWTPPADATARVPDPVLPAAGRSGERTTSRTRRRFRERRRTVIVAWLASMLAAALLAALVILIVHRTPGGAPAAEESPSPARAGPARPRRLALGRAGPGGQPASSGAGRARGGFRRRGPPDPQPSSAAERDAARHRRERARPEPHAALVPRAGSPERHADPAAQRDADAASEPDSHAAAQRHADSALEPDAHAHASADPERHAAPEPDAHAVADRASQPARALAHALALAAAHPPRPVGGAPLNARARSTGRTPRARCARSPARGRRGGATSRARTPPPRGGCRPEA